MLQPQYKNILMRFISRCSAMLSLQCKQVAIIVETVASSAHFASLFIVAIATRMLDVRLHLTVTSRYT